MKLTQEEVEKEEWLFDHFKVYLGMAVLVFFMTLFAVAVLSA